MAFILQQRVDDGTLEEGHDSIHLLPHGRMESEAANSIQLFEIFNEEDGLQLRHVLGLLLLEATETRPEVPEESLPSVLLPHHRHHRP